jgi:hypothetical protein
MSFVLSPLVKILQKLITANICLLTTTVYVVAEKHHTLHRIASGSIDAMRESLNELNKLQVLPPFRFLPDGGDRLLIFPLRPLLKAKNRGIS